MSELTYQCADCGADWTTGKFTEDCLQCGGGALQRSCILCGGRCGSVYHRAVIDSWDSGEAHWVGSCRLSQEEQNQIVKEWLDKNC